MYEATVQEMQQVCTLYKAQACHLLAASGRLMAHRPDEQCAEYSLHAQAHSKQVQDLRQEHEATADRLTAEASAAREELRSANAMHETLLTEYDEEMATQTDAWAARLAQARPS